MTIIAFADVAKQLDDALVLMAHGGFNQIDALSGEAQEEEFIMGMYGNREMKVTVKKEELLEKLAKNREKHCADYVQACKGYKEAAIKALSSRLDKFKDVDPANNSLNLDFSKLPKPVSHERDYDKAIGLLKMHAEDKIVLDMEAYGYYVEDNWEWKAGFAATNSSYSNEG